MDEHTFLIKNFIYDGNGPDTFFWVGSSTRPGPQGFIIPNEKGRTNVLLPYLNKDFTIKLPDGKKITEIKWLSIYDLTIQVCLYFLFISFTIDLTLSSFYTTQENFGDISIEEGFEPPSSQTLTELSRRAHRVSSLSVVIVDSKTISLPEFNYDGLGPGKYQMVRTVVTYEHQLTSCRLQIPTFGLELDLSHQPKVLKFQMKKDSKY